MVIDVPEDFEGKLVILDPDSLFDSDQPPALAWKFDVEGPEGKQQVLSLTPTGAIAMTAFTPAPSPRTPWAARTTP